MRTQALRRVLVDGRAAARATGVRSLATTDETRATAAKRELAVLAEAFQRYDGRAQRPWTRSCQISTRDMREPKKTRIPPRRRRERRLRSL